MQAFRNVRAEMRDTCLSLTRPGGGESRATVARVARSATDEGPSSEDHIEPWMEAAFEGLIHAAQTGDPFALVPCFMNGKPAAVIALARQAGRQTHVMPLFLACQPWMSFGGEPGEGGEDDGGGPDRNANDPPAPR
jgi:hypothetical protein